MRESIRTEISKKFLLLGILPLLTVSVVMVWLTYVHLSEDLYAQQRQRVDTVARLLEGVMEQQLFDASRNIEANALRIQSLEDWQPVLQTYILRRSTVAEVALYSPHGQELLRINRDLLVEENRSPSEVVSQIAPGLSQTGRPQVVQIHTERESGEPVLTIATPFFDLVQAELDYVLISEQRLRPLSLLLNDLPAVPGTTLYLLDANQQILAHQNPSLALRETIHWDESIGDVGAGSVRKGLIGDLALVSVQKVVLGDRTFSVVAEHALWYTIAEHAQSLIGVLILIAFSAMTLLVLRRTISDRIVAPVEQLSWAAQSVAAGDLETRTRLGGDNEVGRLSNAFDTMIENVAVAEAELRSNQARLETTIAERTAALESARIAENRFRQLFEYTSVANIVVDREGRIETTNFTAQRMFGYSAEELKNRTIETLIPNWSTDTIQSSRLLGSPAGAGVERIGKNRAGQDLTLLVSVGEVIQSDQSRVVLSIADVTEQRELQDRLAQSQRMEAIGQLSGGMAHDFNNLLAVILGNLELLRDADLKTSDSDLLERSIDAALRGAELTRNMLSFARQAPLEPTTVDLNRVVSNIKNWISRTLPSTTDVETSLLAGLWKVNIDASSAENALINLIVNARDAMPEGGKLTIETSNVRIDEEYVELRGEEIEPGRYVLLAVSDTGTGISEEDLERIFEPFFTTKPVGSGTGLGLAMLQGFMRQSKGAVRVYSELGVGTTTLFQGPAR